MATSIFDISKKLGLDGKAVLAKAKELGILNAKVVSSPLDDLTAEWLVQELSKANTIVGERKHIYIYDSDSNGRNMNFEPSPFMKSLLYGRRVEKVAVGISWNSTLTHRIYSCPDTAEYQSVIGATVLILLNRHTGARIPVNVCSVTRLPANDTEDLNKLAQPLRERAKKYIAEVGDNPAIIQPGVAHRLYFLSTEPWPVKMQALTATCSLTEWPAVLSISADADRFFRWPKVGELFWPGCVRAEQDGLYQYPPNLLSLLNRLEIKPDTRTNGPAIVSFSVAGGERPSLGDESWHIHHVLDGTEGAPHAVHDGNLFTHSSGLVAAHPVAHHLAHQSALLKWLLRREAFLRFGFDPSGDFVVP